MSNDFGFLVNFFYFFVIVFGFLWISLMHFSIIAPLRGSHGLSAHRAWRTKSSRPEAGPTGRYQTNRGGGSQGSLSELWSQFLNWIKRKWSILIDASSQKSSGEIIYLFIHPVRWHLSIMYTIEIEYKNLIHVLLVTSFDIFWHPAIMCFHDAYLRRGHIEVSECFWQTDSFKRRSHINICIFTWKHDG